MKKHDPSLAFVVHRDLTAADRPFVRSEQSYTDMLAILRAVREHPPEAEAAPVPATVVDSVLAQLQVPATRDSVVAMFRWLREGLLRDYATELDTPEAMTDAALADGIEKLALKRAPAKARPLIEEAIRRLRGRVPG